MPRTASFASLDSIVREAVAPVVRSATQAIGRAIAEIVAEELERALIGAIPHSSERTARVRQARPARSEITKWVADRRARRVPTFVIEMTGLDTKQRIVAKFGESAAFEKGKPLPTTVPGQIDPTKAEPRAVKARQPIRRAAGAK
jgi:hypothetical protein